MSLELHLFSHFDYAEMRTREIARTNITYSTYLWKKFLILL